MNLFLRNVSLILLFSLFVSPYALGYTFIDNSSWITEEKKKEIVTFLHASGIIVNEELSPGTFEVAMDSMKEFSIKDGRIFSSGIITDGKLLLCARGGLLGRIDDEYALEKLKPLGMIGINSYFLYEGKIISGNPCPTEDYGVSFIKDMEHVAGFIFRDKTSLYIADEGGEELLTFTKIDSAIDVPSLRPLDGGIYPKGVAFRDKNSLYVLDGGYANTFLKTDITASESEDLNSKSVEIPASLGEAGYVLLKIGEQYYLLNLSVSYFPFRVESVDKIDISKLHLAGDLLTDGEYTLFLKNGESYHAERFNADKTEILYKDVLDKLLTQAGEKPRYISDGTSVYEYYTFRKTDFTDPRQLTFNKVSNLSSDLIWGVYNGKFWFYNPYLKKEMYVDGVDFDTLSVVKELGDNPYYSAKKGDNKLYRFSPWECQFGKYVSVVMCEIERPESRRDIFFKDSSSLWFYSHEKSTFERIENSDAKTLRSLSVDVYEDKNNVYFFYDNGSRLKIDKYFSITSLQFLSSADGYTKNVFSKHIVLRFLDPSIMIQQLLLSKNDRYYSFLDDWNKKNPSVVIFTSNDFTSKLKSIYTSLL